MASKETRHLPFKVEFKKWKLGNLGWLDSCGRNSGKSCSKLTWPDIHNRKDIQDVQDTLNIKDIHDIQIDILNSNI